MKKKKIQIAANIHSKLIFEICYLIPSATPTPDTKKTLRTLNRMSAQLKNLGLKAISQIPFTVKCGSRLYFLSVRRTMMVSPK